MDGLAILREAEQAGLKLRVEGDKLLVSGPRRAEPIVHRLTACGAGRMLGAAHWISSQHSAPLRRGFS
jgi:hypothetical protein